MSQNMNLQERYSAFVDAKLRDESVMAGLMNTRCQGQPKAGAVKIPVRTDATAGAYTIATGKSLNAPATSYETLICDKDIAVNELIDGYVAEAVPDGMVAERLDSAGYALAHSVDSSLIDMCTSEGTAFTTTKTGAYNIIANAVTKAKKAKVNTEDMWLVVNSDFAESIITDAAFIKASDLGDAVQQNGLIGRIAGVRVYESTNLNGVQVGSKDVKFILGNKVFAHYCAEWMVPVALNDLADGEHIGASAVQGRLVHGEKITQPTTVLYYAP